MHLSEKDPGSIPDLSGKVPDDRYCREGCTLMEAHETCLTAEEQFCVCGHDLTQHAKGPVRDLYCRHCPCPEWEPA